MALYTFANSAAYTSYKLIFNNNKGPDGGANSIQFSEVQLFSGSIPEPAGASLLGLASAGFLLRRHRRS